MVGNNNSPLDYDSKKVILNPYIIKRNDDIIIGITVSYHRLKMMACPHDGASGVTDGHPVGAYPNKINDYNPTRVARHPRL